MSRCQQKAYCVLLTDDSRLPSDRPFTTTTPQLPAICMPFCWSMVATTRRSGSPLWWITLILLLIAFSTVADSMSIPLREVILQWSDAPEMLTSGYQRSSRSFNMGPDVVHEKPRPLRFG